MHANEDMSIYYFLLESYIVRPQTPKVESELKRMSLRLSTNAPMYHPHAADAKQNFGREFPAWSKQTAILDIHE